MPVNREVRLTAYLDQKKVADEIFTFTVGDAIIIHDVQLDIPETYTLSVHVVGRMPKQYQPPEFVRPSSISIYYRPEGGDWSFAGQVNRGEIEINGIELGVPYDFMTGYFGNIKYVYDQVFTEDNLVFMNTIDVPDDIARYF